MSRWGSCCSLLTGIGPLIAWRKASTANLRRQFVAPLASGVSVVLVLAAFGIRDLYPLMTWGLAAFVFGTGGEEFYKGIRARRRMFGEPALLALARLIGRNRRRYGGYRPRRDAWCTSSPSRGRRSRSRRK